MKRYFLSLFLLAGGAELYSTLTGASLVHRFAKPFLLLTLIGYYVFSRAGQPLAITFLLALFFSWAGDVLLMFQQEDASFFIYGLAAFLLAHVLFIFSYRQHRWEDETNTLQGLQRVRFAFPLILSGSGLVVILYPYLGDMKWPVLVYALVITLMSIQALFRYGRTGQGSFVMVFGGSILFMISDSLLAINKFIESLPLADFWIMLTYIAAQLLIVQGIIIHTEKSPLEGGQRGV
ncbi:MAG: lysoplasmalogenase [Flammeovirgaceae bacterium]|nr:MAG: lysoplasmalogenase [Flammeovirgaceae bacterium]